MGIVGCDRIDTRPAAIGAVHGCGGSALQIYDAEPPFVKYFGQKMLKKCILDCRGGGEGGGCGGDGGWSGYTRYSRYRGGGGCNGCNYCNGAVVTEVTHTGSSQRPAKSRDFLCSRTQPAKTARARACCCPLSSVWVVGFTGRRDYFGSAASEDRGSVKSCGPSPGVAAGCPG